ncbi:S8 family serine peptidase [Pseudoalteromonas sp. MB41]|uniref:S8 family serine peptidase n=1 Tax=unclassified Pseudoalteromonas TaxID=194690 RepID=UPI0015D542D8|nr:MULTISPECIES: S8 family serine peptidase [unclassified Pseudoalteromonas]MCC9659076.1 S8 family serine peptidase [Pseudoalteromonas sp. MB41]QLJ07110.1 S8 family serine peptidase [Pseudoalteromonas sp. JSTW]
MRTKLSSILIGLGMVGSFATQAQALLGPELAEKLSTTSLTQSLTEPSIKVIISFKDKQQVYNVMQSLGVPYLALKELPMVGATLTPSLVTQLQNNPAIESIYYDAPLRYYNYNSGEITGGHFVHDNYLFTGKGGVVAVLDSGVDATHPDLAYGDKTIQNVKLINDLDLYGLTADIEGLPNTDTSSGHGTHVAGTVAGSGTDSANDPTRANLHDGIAPDAKIVGISAGEAISILHSLKGFDYALANQHKYDIDVITNSWGGGAGSNFDPNNPVNKASFEAYKRGMIVTFAAGNDGDGDDTLNVYAVAPWVIDVAAGTPNRMLADFSSRGVPGDAIKTPDITAPGSSIYSTRALNTPLPALGPVIDLDNPDYYVYYATMSGTSMATPFVAGAATVLLEANPHLSPDQIDEILKASADDMFDETGRQYLPHEVGAGHINVKKAVELALQTEGNMRQFLAGDTEFSSQGAWQQADNTADKVYFAGKWSETTDSSAYNGTLAKAKGPGNIAYVGFKGERAKIHFAATNQGEVSILVDGVEYESLSVSGEKGEAITVAINQLDDSAHTLEVRTISGQVALDRFEFDGIVTQPGVSFTTQLMPSIEGTMGPSVSLDLAGLGVDPAYSIIEHLVSVPDNVMGVTAVLSWQPFADLDFSIANSQGEDLASSATLDNPETAQLSVTEAGDYIFKVKGYTSVVTNYRIDWQIVTQD